MIFIISYCDFCLYAGDGFSWHIIKVFLVFVVIKNIFMHSIAILGFFALVIVFFFTGRNDFGLKPTSQKIISSEQNNIDEEIKLEEV